MPNHCINGFFVYQIGIVGIDYDDTILALHKERISRETIRCMMKELFEEVKHEELKRDEYIGNIVMMYMIEKRLADYGFRIIEPLNGTFNEDDKQFISKELQVQITEHDRLYEEKRNQTKEETTNE